MGGTFVLLTMVISLNHLSLRDCQHVRAILGLEIVFISLRSDENIKGIKIENNELKLTAYADDASYFMRDEISAGILLNKM